ncbi:Transcription initiation factor TFIID subunit 2 [Pseudocercospora fuligena]|uniref:Transcription initiation factor TFIID subunit 2 n=1 Tax=Pseudocercospora fuligena TaxID=685502 RepID=A0A8H6VK78_9PEZI|nr:Transcription initiation factor TFIID subunit 2 [Pseudocercospora fuligena]
MPAFGEEGVEGAPPPRRDYDILKQRVDLDVDFPTRTLKGSTEITIQPLAKDLRQISLHCRQCRPTSIQVSGINAKFEYEDPYKKSLMSSKSTAHQHQMLKERIQDALRPNPAPQLQITLPPKLKIQELRVDPATAMPVYNGTPSLQKQEADAMAIAETPIQQNVQQAAQFAPIKLTVEFVLDDHRDGIHWVGCDEDDKRYPYLYTKAEPFPGNSSSIFPCLDDGNSRCTWEVAIRCPKTIGDAFKKVQGDTVLSNGDLTSAPNGDVEMVNGTDAPAKPKSAAATKPEYLIDLSPEDAALELAVLCVGDQMDETTDTEDDTRHTISFSLSEAVTARHVGFAIGPFEHVDLTAFRDSEEEAKLGQTAVKVSGYCLPGRSGEVENTCFPITGAVDFISVNCGKFPFPAYQVLFVDDLTYDVIGVAGISICSTRLLFPQEIIEPLDKNTKTLVRAAADQWSGVNIIPKEPMDTWAIAGIAGYLTDVFLKKLCGNNHYRWEQKLAAEKVYDLDVDRPAIWDQGKFLHVDPSIREFMDLKSAVVLGILDRRLVKSSGSTGVMRIINKIFLNAKTGTLTNGELSTMDLQRTCEKLGHNKLESFFKQWVYGAGCPIFHVSQRFNKKKLVVEMTIVQRQLERQTKPEFAPNNFMREIKEHVQEVWAPEIQTVFSGPMTIRIHEADGTPYEHIVEIKEPITKLEIPYNTKYKRLKRSRRAKERAVAEGAAGEEGSDALLYCLGDILDNEQDQKDWNLVDWSAEDEDKMGQESYEWIRMDADFEWIGKMHLVMPLYMYISQLQQDRDLVAQYESMRYLLGSNPHHVSLTILVRTLMDERYFYGIRVMAAEGLSLMAKDKLTEIGTLHLTKAFAHFFCDGDIDSMPRPNDFSSRVSFIMQCAIPRAMSKLRDNEGTVPQIVQRFFVDKLTYNDNSDNAYSDCHYVATLMTCLTDALVASHRIVEPKQTFEFNFDDDMGMEEDQEPINPNAAFEQEAINVIERYRRLDEWIVTYQNIYSTTAIECLQKLTKAGVVKDKAKELLQYTRDSTADNVRIQAFHCLTEIGLTRKSSVMKHLLYNLVHDRSPYFRDRLLRCFGEALGHIALSDGEEKTAAPAPVNDGGLIIEDAGSNEARRIEATRKTTPEGAIAALKIALGNDEVFKQALWYATTHPSIAIDEIGSFCDVAALLFDPVTSHTVTLKLPRPYRCEHMGKGKMRFIPHGNFRTKPSKGLAWEDYEIMEGLGLKYNGPLSDEIKEKIKARENEAYLKAQIAQTQAEMARRQSEAATNHFQSQQQASMPPPAVPTWSGGGIPSNAPTPTEQKSGFKLSLGGIKRKASVDLTSSKDTPKTIKVNKAATPGSAPKISTSRRSSTPGSKAGKSRLVVLDLGIAGSRKATQILSQPPVPGRSSSTQPPAKKLVLKKPSQDQSTSATHSKPQTQSPAGPPAFSPPPSLTSSFPPTNLNLGGFRSFGGAPAEDSGPPGLTSFSASPDTASPVGFRSTSGDATAFSMSPPPPSASPPSLTAAPPERSHSHPHAHPPSLSRVTSLSAMSPSEKKESTNGDAAIQPPKKKFTLKLGVKAPPTS